MWVFGYGSLMWDSWETKYDCTLRVVADLPGYCRRFNKASVRNWGTKANPGPTLNLLKFDTGVCRGIAFRFPDTQEMEVLRYLEVREGKAFQLHKLLVRLEDHSEVSAVVPLYNGQNVIEGKTTEDLAAMVLAASGTSGTCLSYVVGVSEKLSAFGINDFSVSALMKALNTDA